MDADILIIGGGVVGLATAERAARRGLRTVLFEQHPAFGQETSSRNSEVIHAGIYYATGSLKARLCAEGRRQLYALCAERQIPHRRCGKAIVATDARETDALERLMAQGLANGVEGLRMLSSEEVKAREPHVRAAAGLLSEETGILDSHRLMQSFADTAEAHGADLVCGAAVTALARDGGGWRVQYRDSEEEGSLRADAVINCAGLEAQAVMRMAGLDPDACGLRRYLVKGEYFRIGGEKRKRIRGLVYPAPEADLAGLGIHTVIDLGGGVKLGPSALYVDAIDYGVDPASREDFARRAKTYLPWLKAEDLMPDMAGIRPKLAGPGEAARDFYVAEESARGAPGLVTLAGIESPGLTACTAIAEHALSRL